MPEATQSSLEEQEEVFELPQEVPLGMFFRVQGSALLFQIDTFACFVS